MMSKRTIALSLFLTITLTLLAGCGGSSCSPQSSAPPTPAALSSSNVNLIFVASEDLAYQAPGDINRSTANLTNQGLQRSLLMASFLQQKVLGMQNVTEIYALEPMTHLQTANKYPDMVGLETIQQFAMLNQITLSTSDPQGSEFYAGQSYPINASYALRARAHRSCRAGAGAVLRDLPRSGFPRCGRRQRSPGDWYPKGKRTGFLCLLGAMGNRERIDGEHQPARRL